MLNWVVLVVESVESGVIITVCSKGSKSIDGIGVGMRAMSNWAFGRGGPGQWLDASMPMRWSSPLKLLGSLLVPPLAVWLGYMCGIHSWRSVEQMFAGECYALCCCCTVGSLCSAVQWQKMLHNYALE